MAGVYLITVAFAHTSGMAEDLVVNTFHFEHQPALDPTTGEFDDVRNMLWDFYDRDSAPYALPALDEYMSPLLTGVTTFRAYRLLDPSPRVPRYASTQTLVNMGDLSTQPLPSEVALVASLQGTQISGVPPARRKNRKYIGPLNVATLSATTGRPSTVFQTKLAENLQQLLIAANASVSWEWVVRSEVANSSTAVVGGWVDNAFDTQRRRGEDASSRILWDTGTP